MTILMRFFSILILSLIPSLCLGQTITKVSDRAGNAINPATNETVLSIRSAIVGSTQSSNITNASVTVNRQNGATPTFSRVATSTTSTTLLSASANHKGRFIFNDVATSYLYVALGSSATTTTFQFKLAPYETLMFDPGDYSGVVSGVLDTGTGSANVTGITQ